MLNTVCILAYTIYFLSQDDQEDFKISYELEFNSVYMVVCTLISIVIIRAYHKSLLEATKDSSSETDPEEE